jgi:ribosomal protein S18 acetylase RimI-like enzyme
MISVLTPVDFSDDLLKELHCLDNDYFPNPWSMDQWLNLKNSEIIYLFRGEDLKIRGFALFELNNLESLGHLYKILTIPKFRTQKHASRLMVFAIDDLKRRKVDRIYLEVATNNSVGVNFYESFNFEVLTTKQKFYRNGDDAFAMQRTL